MLSSSQKKILVVDDEQQILVSVKACLTSAGIKDVQVERESARVAGLLKENEYSLVILDLLMPQVTGLDILKLIKEEYPSTAVLMLTAVNDIASVVTCMQEGASDYLTKPIRREDLLLAVNKILEQEDLTSEVDRLKRQLLYGELADEQCFRGITTRSPKIGAIFKYLEAIKKSPKAILLEGETGTGKELFAKTIHQLICPDKPFAVVNVAGLDESSFNDTLFGHVKGAFTGAEQSREGMVAKAHDGICFLDEIGDLEPRSQVKLLRLLQEKTFQALGSDQNKRARARFVLATNVNLDDAVAQGKFRKDLFYRLQAHRIIIPPLRERLEDIPLLVDVFLSEAAAQLDKKKPTPPPELYSLLNSYEFPGNIRELESLIYDAVSMHGRGKLSLAVFKAKIYGSRKNEAGASADLTPKEFGQQTMKISGRLPTLKQAEMMIVREAMRQADNNQGLAASFLGISRQALNRRLLQMKNEGISL